MTSDEEVIENLKFEFFEKFKNKYELSQDTPLGKGHYACVFKAFDKDRNIDVAIKIFFSGIAPDGSQRGWHITSSVIHNQIAQTSTIETFHSNHLNKDCKAVIQRYVPGKPLKSILDKFNTLEQNPSYQIVLNDFGLTYFKSLLNVLNFCHSQGFGHGDCHDGNIMVFSESHLTKHTFRVVLIDFDNSSIKKTLNAKTEKEKIESDIGLLKYFFDKTFIDWKYYEAVKRILASYKTLTEIQFSYSIVSEYIEHCIKETASKENILKVLSMFPHPFMGFHIPPTINCLKMVAEISKTENVFNEALDEYIKNASNPDNWNHELSIEKIEGNVTEIYKNIFEN
jgi:tRNA A-37 threonylcarbamoyl transferase component Bud32